MDLMKRTRELCAEEITTCNDMPIETFYTFGRNIVAALLGNLSHAQGDRSFSIDFMHFGIYENKQRVLIRY